MILDHVTDCTSFFIKFSTPSHAEIFRHRDLHTLDVIAVPYGLEVGIRKAKKEKIGNRFLAEVVIDAENLRLREHRMQDPVELRGRLDITAKRFFYDDACVGRTCG